MCIRDRYKAVLYIFTERIVLTCYRHEIRPAGGQGVRRPHGISVRHPRQQEDY